MHQLNWLLSSGIKPEDTPDVSTTKTSVGISKPGIFTAANIATGVGAIANTLISLKGISDTKKSNPTLIANAQNQMQ